MITKELLKHEIDELENKQTLELVYQLIQNLKKSAIPTKSVKKYTDEERQQAMNEFFGMHKELGIDSVEQELHLIRQGRRRLFNDI
jgi:hypothetical protein